MHAQQSQPNARKDLVDSNPATNYRHLHDPPRLPVPLAGYHHISARVKPELEKFAKI
ncbi:MAG: hypothetical protein ACUVRS_06235 [Armatimonadota bacterium]